MGLVGLEQLLQRTIRTMLGHYTEFINGEVLRGGPWTERGHGLESQPVRGGWNGT